MTIPGNTPTSLEKTTYVYRVSAELTLAECELALLIHYPINKALR